ncbi:MAG TPA: hypothetical protein VFY08_02805 [Actinomycetota bacterium]|jgi:hypothetical protein|nr:hypothetical protein [Actinomycetota bacterium]
MEAPSDDELRRAGKALALGFALGLVLLALARRAPGRRGEDARSG